MNHIFISKEDEAEGLTLHFSDGKTLQVCMTPGSGHTTSGDIDLTIKNEFNFKEAMEYLGLKHRALLELTENKGPKGIRHERVNYRTYKFLRKDLDRFIEKRRFTPPEKKAGKYANSP
jgi:hypothetical protein